MIDAVQARAVAEQLIVQPEQPPTEEPYRQVIDDRYTVEDPVGWVFVTQSDRYLRTGKFGDRLIGNSAIFVDRADGSVRLIPTYQTIADFLEEYRAWRTASPPAEP